MNRVLIVGVSTRAAAESAVRAGFDVTTIDAFADLDQDPRVRLVPLERDSHPRFTAAAAARAAQSVACDAVVYLSSFENHPRAVSSLAAERALWGNTPDVLRRVRDPWLVARVLRARGISVPAVPELPTERMEALTLSEVGGWLIKPVASGGGHGVRRWQSGLDANLLLARRCYLQELIQGTPGSVMFVAARGKAVPLGISRQLVGESAFGAVEYQYCGNILASANDPQFTRDQELMERSCSLASATAEEFGLVGVNGIDFMARGGVAYLTEVNPRWSASMELSERAYDLSVFAMHASACMSGVVPNFDLRKARQHGGAMGKAVVFARRDVVMGDTHVWLGDSSVRDVPHPGERIPAGRPVCTVFASGANASACHAALVERAQRVYAELVAWETAALPLSSSAE